MGTEAHQCTHCYVNTNNDLYCNYYNFTTDGYHYYYSILVTCRTSVGLLKTQLKTAVMPTPPCPDPALNPCPIAYRAIPHFSAT